MQDKTTIYESIQSKHREVQYDSKTIKTSQGVKPIKLKGKINCPVLNDKITPIVCSKYMDAEGWPRCVSKDICDKAECYIHKSINRNINTQGVQDGIIKQ